MKTFRAIAAVAFCAVSAGTVLAQQPRAGATPPTAPPVTVNVPETKIALVNTDEFANEKTGVFRLVSAMKRVGREFEARRVEIQTLRQQTEKATADLQQASKVRHTRAWRQQRDKIDQMKKDYTRKGKDAQGAYQKRLEEVLRPVYDDIGKALDVYAKAHGITLVLDVTKVQGIVSAEASLYITRAFIAEFNSKNPVRASLTQPK